MKAGVFQCAGGGLTSAQRLDKLAEQLAQQSLDLLVCPELFLSGYAVGDALPEMAESLGDRAGEGIFDGPFAGAVSELARQYNTAIVYGYPERDGDALYNSAACIGADGKLVANHRKLLLPPGFEAEYFTNGSGLTLFELGGLRCAILICYDAEFPEMVRAAAQAGAQVVIVPTALNDAWAVVAEQVMPVRAFENGVWLLYANHAGTEGEISYLGGSCIAAPDGSDAARAGSEECVIAAELDAEQVQVSQARLPYLEGVQQLSGKLN